MDTWCPLLVEYGNATNLSKHRGCSQCIEMMQVLNLKQIHKKDVQITHWWKSVWFKKDSFIQHRESEWSKR